MKRPEWKQKTVADQLTTTLGALEGEVSNFDENIIGKDLFVERALGRLEELRELQHFVQHPEQWDVA